MISPSCCAALCPQGLGDEFLLHLRALRAELQGQDPGIGAREDFGVVWAVPSVPSCPGLLRGSSCELPAPGLVCEPLPGPTSCDFMWERVRSSCPILRAAGRVEPELPFLGYSQSVSVSMEITQGAQACHSQTSSETSAGLSCSHQHHQISQVTLSPLSQLF